jgi:hypothetical protein
MRIHWSMLGNYKHIQQFNIIFTLCVRLCFEQTQLEWLQPTGGAACKGKRTILATFGFLLGEKEKN